MNTFIRRITLGLRKDREEMSLTITMYLNILSMFLKRCLSNFVMGAIALSVLYWLAFAVLSLSPMDNIGSKLWLIYTDENRILAAKFAILTVFSGALLYLIRVYQVGKFIEHRYIEEDILFSEAQMRNLERFLSEKENNNQE